MELFAERKIQLDLEPGRLTIAMESPDPRATRHRLPGARSRREQSPARLRGRTREVTDEPTVDVNRYRVGLMRVVILDDEIGIDQSLVAVAGRSFENVREVGRVSRLANDFGGEQAVSRNSRCRGRGRATARCAEQPAQDLDVSSRVSVSRFAAGRTDEPAAIPCPDTRSRRCCLRSRVGRYS